MARMGLQRSVGLVLAGACGKSAAPCVLRAANAFYKAESALWDIDFDWQGFEWLVPDDNHNNVVVFLRRDQAGNELLCAVNFSPNDYENYRVGVPPRKRYVPAFTTDAPEFGGSGFADTKPLTVKDTPSHGKEQSVALRLPAFGAVFLRGEGQLYKARFGNQGEKSEK